MSRVSLQEVCDAAGWSSAHTFVRFYNLDMIHTRTGTSQYGVVGINIPIASTSDAV